MAPSAGDRTSLDGLLRAGALVAALALPAAWLVSLGERPDLVWTNLFRVLGALLGGGAAWFVHRRQGAAASWGTFLGGGIAGSLAVSGLSVLLPVLGRVSASGWLMSGVVGGGMVALAVYAVRGRVGE